MRSRIFRSDHWRCESGRSESQRDSHIFILADLIRILKNIEQITQGTDSADDLNNLFEDLDLTFSKLGVTEKAKNTLEAKVLIHLYQIDFNLFVLLGLLNIIGHL